MIDFIYEDFFENNLSDNLNNSLSGKFCPVCGKEMTEDEEICYGVCFKCYATTEQTET